jgi:hypothetical protein
VLSEALWGLATAGGAAVAGTVATDIWRSVRLRCADRLGRGAPAARERIDPEPTASGRLDRAAVDVAGTRTADTARETGHRPRSRSGSGSGRTRVQQNICRDGGTQHITLSGAIIVGSESRGPR